MIFSIEVPRIKLLSILFIDWLIARYGLKKLFGGGVSAAAVRGGKTNILKLCFELNKFQIV
jgi:hypothetical protein